MASNPNLLFALTEALSKGTPGPKPDVKETHTKNPQIHEWRHGCVGGVKVANCSMCAGHVPRNKIPCSTCKGMGFTTEKCALCVQNAAKAFEALVHDEASATAASEEVKEAEKKGKDVEKKGKLADQ